MTDVMTGRLIVTGVDAAGRSCLVQEGTVTPQSFPGFDGITVARLYGSPAPAIAEGGRAAENLNLGVLSGALNWIVLEYGPGVELSLHHTDTIDLDLVLSGSVELILDDGAHPLGPGDSAVVTGVDHGWRTGPDGCWLSVVSFGVAATNSSTPT